MDCEDSNQGYWFLGRGTSAPALHYLLFQKNVSGLELIRNIDL